MTKPRVFISHDGWIGSEEKDDFQSLIHALMFQDRIDIQGIASTSSRWGGTQRISDTHKILDVYAQDWAKLDAKADGFKTASELKAISYQGATKVAPPAGYSTATASSAAIIQEAKEAAAAGEKLWVLTWGGETDLAQALHDDPSIAPHIRFMNIYNQDPAAKSYIAKNFKGELGMWIDNMSTFRGMYGTPEAKTLIKGFHDVHAKGHGALGDKFYSLSLDVIGQEGVKMGDSPTILYLIDKTNNLDPTAESWGGEYRKVSEGYWTDRTDSAFNWGSTDGAMTIYEDRAAWLKDFEQRFDWIKGAADGGLQVRVSGDPSSTGVDPIVSILVDGVYKGSFAVTADHADGEWQDITIEDDWTASVDHKVEVKFYKEASSQAVYVDSVSLNGATHSTNGTALTSSTALYWLAADAL